MLDLELLRAQMPRRGHNTQNNERERCHTFLGTAQIQGDKRTRAENFRGESFREQVKSSYGKNRSCPCDR